MSLNQILQRFVDFTEYFNEAPRAAVRYFLVAGVSDCVQREDVCPEKDDYLHSTLCDVQ